MFPPKVLNVFKKADSVYLSLLAILIFYRILVLVFFNYRITDGDQTVMWQAVTDYSRGIFHEPRFYGQNYNAMLEALLAVPLYLLGIPAYKALGIVTNLMAILPFILISWIACRRNQKIQAYFILAFSLFLAPEYDLITSMPRGFITGIFFAAIGSLAVFYPENRKWFILSGFFFALGYVINPNSIIISAPCLLYLFLINYRKIKFYLFEGIGILPGAILNYSANYFYVTHPAYNLHNPAPPSFSFKLLVDAFSNLDRHFDFLVPFFWKMGWGILLIFVILAWIFFYHKQYKEAVVVIASFALIVISLGFDRMYKATNSIFFSHARMFLAIPVLISVFIPFLKFTTTRFKYYFLLLAAGFTLEKSITLEKTIYSDTFAYDPYSPTYHMVNVSRIRDLERECRIRKLLSDKYGVSLVMDVWNPYATLATYGCASCQPGFPATLYPYYERRTWLMTEEEKQVHKNIMIVGYQKTPDPFIRRCAELKLDLIRFHDYFIIRNNTVPTIRLIRLLNLDIREF